MAIPVKDFKNLDKAIKDARNLQLVSPLRMDLIEGAERSFDKASFCEIFEQDYGFKCPKSLQNLLALPDSVSMQWKGDGCAGELKLYSPGIGPEKHVDASYRVDSKPDLTDMAILDQVTVISGPHFVLYDAREVDLDGLWLFDGQDIEKLALGPEEYVATAALCGAFDSWQFLFIDGSVTPDRKKAMHASFAVIKEILPARDYSAIEAGFARLD